MSWPNTRVEGRESRRRVSLVMVVGLVLVVGVAAAGLVVFRHFDRQLDNEIDDATLCVSGASKLPGLSVQPTVGAGPDVSAPVFSVSASRTNAAGAAAELARAHLSQHPWDQMSPDTSVVRCQSGSAIWLVDRDGHVTLASNE